MPQAVDVHYHIEGEGPAIFLIHGISASHHAWAGVVKNLKKEFTCISYDLRGHGQSPKATTPYSLDEMVADLEQLRKKLGIEQAHIAGHSLGGMIGPAYAKAYPERTLSVGLLSTAAGRTKDDSSKVLAVVEKLENEGIAAILDALVGRWFTDEFAAKSPELIASRLAQVQSNDPDVFATVFRMYAETEMAPWLDQVHTPALVLTGECDGGCNPRLNTFIAEQLPNAKLVILDNLKHAIMFEAPNLVSEHLLSFLRENNPT